MNPILKSAVENTGMNVHSPFFGFQEGQSRESMAAQLDALQAVGIDSYIGCVRSSQYMGSSFWKDMDVMIEELQKRNMTFFIQDEQGFPSGEANGWIKTRRPDLAKLFIDHRHIDAVGPMAGASFPMGAWLDPNNFADTLKANIEKPQEGAVGMAAFGSQMGGPRYPRSTMYKIIAYRKSADGKTLSDPVDLSDKMVGDWLYWDVPEGHWRIVMLYRTTKSTGRQYYVNMIDADSVRVFIDALYEPMWERYHEYFGKTFRGFFTDEPEFGNYYGYEPRAIGKQDMPLPWCNELERIIADRMGADIDMRLAALWYNLGDEINAEVRVGYMNLITELYTKNFTGQIGKWCEEHGVIYTGHLVEDSGNHTRLASGAGHFFRAEFGQTMAGIDLIDNQLLPGHDNPSYRNNLAEIDGEEFTYALAKYASSAAHLDAKKQGRSLCETATQGSLKQFKWICDNLTSRGINQMMPNYREGGGFGGRMGGKNPQYRYFKYLTNYLTRVCKLLRGGKMYAPAAVLYHAEAEWACGEYMNCARPIKVMAQSQIDCDIIPLDVFTQSESYQTSMGDGYFKINETEYRALVIPYMEYITPELVKVVDSLPVPVCFVDAAPSKVVADGALPTKYEVVPLAEVANWLTAKGAYDVKTATPSPELFYQRYQQDDMMLYMLFNESYHIPVKTTLTVPETGGCVLYDAMSNRFFEAPAKAVEGGTAIEVELAPFETIFVLFGGYEGANIEPLPQYTESTAIETVWDLSTATGDDYPAFTPAGKVKELVNMGAPGKYQEFYGTLRYEADITLPVGTRVIDLGKAYDTAEVFVNGVSAGGRICPPYRFEIGDLLKDGVNHLAIDITCGNRSLQNQTLQLEPFGLFGPVKAMK